MTNLKDSIKKCKPCKASSSNINYYTDFNNFPSVGESNTLYVDTSTGATYIWNGTSYITDNQASASPEERVCLNTGAPFLVADPNNPTIAEVEAWAILNLTIQQRENGTKLVYFVAGDGGSCDVPDYEWTLNKGSQLVTLSNKRVFNTKTVYVDGGSGSDVTGRRGYREFPFKTLDAAIAVTQTGDLLKVFTGSYTQTVSISTLFGIDCDNGVTWTIATGVRMFQSIPFTIPTTVNYKFDVLNRLVAGQIHSFTSTEELNINLIVNTLDIKGSFYWNTYGVVNYYIKNNINSSVGIANYLRNGPIKHTLVIENAVRQDKSILGIETTDNSVANIHIKNLKSVNSLTGGYGNTSTLAYYFGTDTGINKQYNTVLGNVTHDDPSIYATPAGPLDGSIAWRGTTSATPAGLLVAAGQSHRTGSIINLDIKNIKSTGHGVRIGSNGIGDNITVNVKIKGVFEKGVPIYTHRLDAITNSKIIIDLDVECYTSMGVFLGFAAGTDNNIHPSNQVIITGRIKTRYAGMSCISIGTGSAASNNTNGTILLKDLTLINDGTVSPIMCALPENVQIQNVTSNSLVIDPNILEVGQSIIRNTNYK